MARPRVMVVGPSVQAAGGIAAVTATLLDSPLAKRFDLEHVRTHTDSGPAGKVLRGVSGVLRASLLMATGRVDLAYLQTSSGFSLRRKAVVAMVARLLRCPYVVHIHGSHFDSWYRSTRGWEQRLVRRTLRHAALVIALSPTWEARLREIVDCRSTAIPNPVQIPDVAASLATSPPSIVSLGRLGERKGSRITVQALALLEDRHPAARLVLAGDGDIDSVREEARRLGVDERVDLPGWIDAEERARTLSTANVFVLPAREEGLPVAMLEAMAYGLPAVVSRAGGIPDVFVEGRHGYFVLPDDPDDLAEKLRRVLDDPETARLMGRNAREDAVARFAVDVVADELGDALERVLEGSRHAANSGR